MNGPEPGKFRSQETNIPLDTQFFNDAVLPSASLIQPVRLGDGDVFILDDQREHLSTVKEALESLFDCPPETIHTINPLEIGHSIRNSVGVGIVQATVAPIFAALSSRRPPALVITDFEMKAVTGDQIINALLERFSERPPFKIMLSSANSDSASLSGYDVFLPKPLRLNTLRAAIQSLFPVDVG